MQLELITTKELYELTEDEAAIIRKEIQDNYIVEGDLKKKLLWILNL